MKPQTKVTALAVLFYTLFGVCLQLLRIPAYAQGAAGDIAIVLLMVSIYSFAHKEVRAMFCRLLKLDKEPDVQEEIEKQRSRIEIKKLCERYHDIRVMQSFTEADRYFNEQINNIVK